MAAAIYEPEEAVVKDAVKGVASRHTEHVHAVVAHGSWVRGDFWPGQSDLDLIVVTGSGFRGDIQTEFESLGSTLGLRVEPWLVPESEIERWREERTRNPARQIGIVQLDIAGFDVMENHIVLWSASGADPLSGFPVLRGELLRECARARVRGLLNEIEGAEYREREANRIACDALKAATIFFLLKKGFPPTRDKREMLHQFRNVVPDTPTRRETAGRIWELYEAGNKGGGTYHRELCVQFVRELVDIVLAPP